MHEPRCHRGALAVTPRTSADPAHAASPRGVRSFWAPTVLGGLAALGGLGTERSQPGAEAGGPPMLTPSAPPVVTTTPPNTEAPVCVGIGWSARDGVTTVDGPAMAAVIHALAPRPDATGGPWLTALSRLCADLTAYPGAASLSIVRWPSEPDGRDAAWIVSLPGGPADTGSVEQALGAVHGGAVARGVAIRAGDRVWGWDIGPGTTVRVAGGEAGVAALRQQPRPDFDEFKAHMQAHLKGVGGEDGASREGPLRVWIDVNLLRRQAPDRFADGPEGRLLDAFGLANARAVSVVTRSGAPLTVIERRTRLLRLSLAWSSRSWAPGTVRSAVVGESTWPAGLNVVLPASPAWVLAARTDVGSSPLALGWGGIIRRLATVGPALLDSRAAAREGTEAQQRWFGDKSDEQRGLTRALNPWLVMAPEAAGGLWLLAPMRESVGPSDRAAIEAGLHGLLTPIVQGAGEEPAPSGPGEDADRAKAAGAARWTSGTIAPGWRMFGVVAGMDNPRAVQVLVKTSK